MSLLTSKVRDEYWEFELELIANLLQPFKVPQKIVFDITSVSHFCALFWSNFPPQFFGRNLFWSHVPFCRIKLENGLVKIAKHACVCSWSHFFPQSVSGVSVLISPTSFWYIDQPLCQGWKGMEVTFKTHQSEICLQQKAQLSFKSSKPANWALLQPGNGKGQAAGGKNWTFGPKILLLCPETSADPGSRV